jgi:endonuclease/exonuclease/phosphatase family metal-dependent hydrolase
MTAARTASVLAWAVLAAGSGAAGEPAGSAVAFVGRTSARHVRVMTQNAGANSIFAGAPPAGDGAVEPRHVRFARVVQAIAPDVLCLQEVFPPRTGADVGALLDALLPLAGRTWQTHHVHDTVIASRFDIRSRGGEKADFGSGRPRGHTVAVVDVPGESHDVAVVCAHFDSRDQTAARLKHGEAVAAAIRELRAVAPPVPAIVVLGDLNAYANDGAPHVTALLALPGERGPLLRDALPVHNATGSATWTFRNPGLPFPPAALDRVLYDGAALEKTHSFVLDTTVLPAGDLAGVGLRPADVLQDVGKGVHDHLPVVVDFVPRAGPGKAP